MGFFGANNKRGDNQARQFFDEAFRSSGECAQMLIRKSDLYPVFLSSNFERFFGVSMQRMREDAEVLFRFVPEESRSLVRSALRGWDQKAPLELFSRYQSQGEFARERYLRFNFSSVLEDSYILVCVVDVTEGQSIVEAAREKRDKALRQMRERTDFLGQMSHEIRTPLNGIRGMISIARDHVDEPDLLLEDLSRVDELSSYLLSLVNDVLDMSRLNSGRVELEQLPFDIRLVAKDLFSMFESQARERGLDFTVEYGDCRHAFVLGDRLRLNQVLVNFVSNALKFTPEGGRVQVVFREMYGHNGHIRYMIRVRDTGKGMDPCFVSRIFKPFEQEDQTIARKYGGTGLGMAISEGLVSLMGGEIVVDTELGRGSDFTAYVPFEPASAEQAGELAKQNETIETRNDSPGQKIDFELAGRRLLMAEDNDLNALIALQVLQAEDAIVDVANDGPVVVGMFENSEPFSYDAILMDIQMPTFNGWEAARRIRSLDRPDAKGIPIIALSANNCAEDATASLKAGLDGHAGKPIIINELKAQLAAALARSGYRKAN